MVKSYLIFVIVLTIVYIIYYAVLITRELYGKKRETKSEEEFFELDNDDDEESVAVAESEGGFIVGNDNYETDSSEISVDGLQETAPPPCETIIEKMERMKARAEERMEETVPFLSDSLTSEEMYKAMISGGRIGNHPEMEWKLVKDKL